MPERPDRVDAIAIGDDELERAAMTAAPFDPFGPEIEPFDSGDPQHDTLLPEWYMPAPTGRRTRGRTLVMVGIAVSLLVINVGGFCVTYGFPEFVWN